MKRAGGSRSRWAPWGGAAGGGAVLGLLLAVLLLVAACATPGQQAGSATAEVGAAATGTPAAAASPAGTAAVPASPTQAATSAPAATTTMAATATTPAAATVTTVTTTTATTAVTTAATTTTTTAATTTATVGTPARATAAPATPSPGRGTAGAAARGTPAPFNATKDEPCRRTDYENRPLPERPATTETIEQAYRCLLLHYVDQKLDHRTLLNGAWSYLAQAGQGVFTAEDTAPLALTGDREADWQVFEERFDALARKYRRVEESVLARVAVEGMARGLDDNHVFYLAPKLWQRTYAQSTGENTIIGPGFDLAVEESSGRFYLYSVYPNSSAARAGLKAGDIIETVGGRPARRGEGNQALYNLLTGEVGTKAQIQVTRPATGQTVRGEVAVEQVEVPLIESRTIPTARGKVGYIRLRNFSNNAGEEFDKALAALQREGITGLVFDVRQNPGGSVDALTHILSHFTHDSPIAITTDAEGKREEVELDRNVPLLGLPFVVLANGSSASSADITAAVARARGGYLIGEKTAGALGGAYLYELEDGGALEITAYRVVGPNGEVINEVGVAPDEVVPLTPADLSAGNDPQLQRALDYLASR